MGIFHFFIIWYYIVKSTTVRIVWSYSQRVLLWGQLWNRALERHLAGRTQKKDENSSLELRIRFRTSPLLWYTGRTLFLKQLLFTFNFWIHFPTNLHKGHCADTQCWLGCFLRRSHILYIKNFHIHHYLDSSQGT